MKHSLSLKERILLRTGPKLENGCMEWKGTIGRHGYGVICFKRRILRSNRAVYEVYNGPIPENMCVCHSCDNPTCVNPEHLWLGTMKDNMIDKVRKGRAKVGTGERHGHAKLTWVDVRNIREEYKTMSSTELAEKYNIHQTTITNICSMKRWQDEAYQPYKKIVHKRLLTEKDVIEIRKKYIHGKRGYGYISLAKEFGLKESCIYNIIKNKTYKEVK